MESENAVRSLSALAHEGRLAIVRVLVRAGPQGVPAGDIARTVDAPANTVSAQLAILAGAGLISRRRVGRTIRYAADYGALGGLIAHLMADCCAGRPEVSAPVLAAAACSQC